MPKATGLPSLNLSASRNNVGHSPISHHSADSPRSPRSAPPTPRLSTAPASMMQQVNNTQENAYQSQKRSQPSSPRITAMPEIPPSPSSPKAPPTSHGRDPSKSFFSNLMASKSSHKLNSSENLNESHEKQQGRSRASSKDRSLHTIRKQGSTPELPRYNSNNAHVSHEHSNSTPAAEMPQMLPPKQKPKSKLGGMLSRTRTLKLDDAAKPSAGQQQLHLETHPDPKVVYEPPLKTPPLKTAPLNSDHRQRAFGVDNQSSPRNRSADRQGRGEPITQRNIHAANLPPSHSFVSNVQTHGKGMGDRLGKMGKGLFGRMTRSGSSHERELVTDDTYVCSVINLSLIKQTRKTRIARRLELSRDKTEFWMPALPWRAIE